MWTTNWKLWALGSAVFAALTAILAKVGVTGVNPNLATAVRTGVVLVFAWSLAWATDGVRGLPDLSARQRPPSPTPRASSSSST